MIHIKLNMIFYTHIEHSPTKTIYIKYYTKNKQKNALQTHIIGLEQCGPNLYSQNAKSYIFWEHVFKAHRLHYYRTEPRNTSELLAEPVLHNERIKIGNKVISYTQWIEKGVYNLANFVGNTGKLLTFNTAFIWIL